MSVFESEAEYNEWITRVAKNRLERDPSRFGYVANHLLISSGTSNGEGVLHFNAEPYLIPGDDQEYHTERVWPKDILKVKSDIPRRALLKGSLRGIAVETVAQDLERATVELDEDVEGSQRS